MTDYGIFYAYWARDWAASPAEVREYVSRASGIGFDLLSLRSEMLFEWSESEKEALRQRTAEEGVDLSFHVALTPDTDISSPDPETRRRGVEHLERAIEVVDALDGRVLGGSVYAPSKPSFTGGPEEKAERMEQSIEMWKEVADIAETHDVLCTVEPLNRFETFMLNTAEEADTFVDRIDSPNVQLLLDTFHMNIEENGMAEAIHTAGDRLGHFHVGENNRRPPQRGGNMPWEEIAAALGEVGYDGPIGLEPFVRPDGDVAQDVGVWRDLSGGEDLDVTAERSLEFLRGIFEG